MAHRRNIFLLLGQSNMAGRGDLNDVPAIADDRIEMFRNHEWLKAHEPLHQDNKHIAGIGAGMSFAQKLITHDLNIKIGLLPCAKGWTSISDWMPGTPLYSNALSITKEAMLQGELKGILWHQGENDTFNFPDALAYGDRLTKIILGLRNDLNIQDLPFISGELGYFLSHLKEFECVAQVNHHLNDLKNSIKNYGCINAKGLKPKSDKIHFDSKSLRTMGMRFAQEYLNQKSIGEL